jgi:hypothetical protein
MIISSKILQGYSLHSHDGDLGTAKDFYFDDRHWAIRYLVAETGRWLTSRQVLISPYALGEVMLKTKRIDIDLSKKQIEDSPPLGSNVPVSMQFERDYYGYYGWPVYWGTPLMWGYYPDIVRNKGKQTVVTHEDHKWDHHLRSTREVRGYHLQATDGEIGHMEDFLIDDETWAIRYLVINTGNWWSGKNILVSPTWIHRVSWSESKIYIDISREEVKKAPEYFGERMLTKEDENALHRHYHREVGASSSAALAEPRSVP